MGVEDEKINGSRAPGAATSAEHWDERYGRRHLARSSAGRRVNDSVARTIERLLPHGVPAKILDVAAGTGELVRALAAQGRVVVGADISHAAMSWASGRGGCEGAAHYVVADAGRLAFADASFDALTCVRSVWTFADAARCLSEFRRVLRRNAPLVVQTWGAARECRLITAGAAVLARHVGEVLRPEGVRGPFDFAPEAFAPMVTAAGFSSFESVEHREMLRIEGVGHYWDEFAGIAETAHLLFSRQPASVREKVGRQLENVFKKMCDGEGALTLPLTWHVCVARA